MVLSKNANKKALIRLHGCAGWSAPLLFANLRRQVFLRLDPYDWTDFPWTGLYGKKISSNSRMYLFEIHLHHVSYLIFYQHMTMMFEVQDLAVASPATVSRCGMVYLEPSYIGIDPFVECWLRFLPENIYPYKEKLQDLFSRFMEVCI